MAGRWQGDGGELVGGWWGDGGEMAGEMAGRWWGDGREMAGGWWVHVHAVKVWRCPPMPLPVSQGQQGYVRTCWAGGGVTSA